MWWLWRHCHLEGKLHLKWYLTIDQFQNVHISLQNIGELLRSGRSDLEDKLERIGDSIVHKLIEWVTRLPFYNQLPKEVLTKLLTHKWHELLVLTTSAYQAIHGDGRIGTTRTDGETVELHQEVLDKHDTVFVNESWHDIDLLWLFRWLPIW